MERQLRATFPTFVGDGTLPKSGLSAFFANNGKASAGIGGKLNCRLSVRGPALIDYLARGRSVFRRVSAAAMPNRFGSVPPFKHQRQIVIFERYRAVEVLTSLKPKENQFTFLSVLMLASSADSTSVLVNPVRVRRWFGRQFGFELRTRGFCFGRNLSRTAYQFK